MKYLLLLALLISCAGDKPGFVQVDDPKIKFVEEPMKNTALFVVLKNSGGKDVSLVKASSTISEAVELHEMIMDGGEMKMRPVDKMVVKAGSSLELKPGGLHIMFIGLKEPLQLDEKKTVQLFFDNGQEFTLEVPIQNVDKDMHHHHH
jgi:periplasmic copper chaperone A